MSFGSELVSTQDPDPAITSMRECGSRFRLVYSTGKYKAYLHWNKNLFLKWGILISIEKIYICPFNGFWSQIRNFANVNADVIQEIPINADPCWSWTGSGTLDMTVHDMKKPTCLVTRPSPFLSMDLNSFSIPEKKLWKPVMLFYILSILKITFTKTVSIDVTLSLALNYAIFYDTRGKV